ncbi:MAG: NAD(P)H-dependent oxidoreductase [Endomicrobium sp.]|nr:NAD(P)H-dependent oxidoreductase [Endomicrobium sp.]
MSEIIKLLAPKDFEVDSYDNLYCLFILSVTKFKKKVSASDGVIFITPEYNCLISGVLKNAVDWVS